MKKKKGGDFDENDMNFMIDNMFDKVDANRNSTLDR